MSLSSTMTMSSPPQPYTFPAPPSRPTISTSLSDQFLSARVDSSRRMVSPEHRRRPSSNSPIALDSVPEDHHLGVGRRSPTSPLRPAAQATGGRRSSSKGKERDISKAVHEQREYVVPKRKRAEWVIDLDEVQKGAKAWSDRERVILIIGSPSINTLAPLLYNPAFSRTLLLIGSKEPLPEIQAFLSSSHILSHTQIVYPTVQPFSLPAGSLPNGVSHIPAIITEATSLAQQYRTNSAYANPNPRRDSDDSNSSNLGNRTPLLRSRKSSAVSINEMRDSAETARPRSNSGFITRGHSDTSLVRPKSFSRLSSFSRSSMFGLSKATETDSKVNYTGGSPFDAVINIMPAYHDFTPDRALQDMLHQAVVLTTAVMPMLTRQPLKGSSADLAISLLHILPKQVPGPLPAVLESFLLSFLPSFGVSSEREIWGSVISGPLWSTARVDENASGVETLLFGGVRCPSNVLSSQGEPGDFKPRAFLPNWSSCMAMPGLLAEARRPTSGQTPPVARASRETQPIAYTDVEAAEAHTSPLLELPRQPMRSKLSSLAFSSDTISQSSPGQSSPGVPELDPSHSSCSSWSGFPDSVSEGGDVPPPTPMSEMGSVKTLKSFGSWFKVGKKAGGSK
ncbi:hypothetical protein BCR39DRAFT_507534 [Naematelia encephala]|uniref:Uncharacterized protein n=1 Tax=Naematelia encephala TaxID=71784 RepID=A0A1Y2APQ0_9TREE|nr:hypothetical protein BCR39DRAFT_507534 [Naematelia encephala]